MSIVLVLSLALAIASASGAAGATKASSSAASAVICEELPWDMCAFAVSSEGWRCVLEKSVDATATQILQCQTSRVRAVDFAEWVEMDECFHWCGADRMWIGMSSDALLDHGFATALCSAECQNNCPNVIHIFSNMAMDEGFSLEGFCEQQQQKTMMMRARKMGEDSSSSSRPLSWRWSMDLSPAPSPS